MQNSKPLLQDMKGNKNEKTNSNPMTAITIEKGTQNIETTATTARVTTAATTALKEGQPAADITQLEWNPKANRIT